MRDAAFKGCEYDPYDNDVLARCEAAVRSECARCLSMVSAGTLGLGRSLFFPGCRISVSAELAGSNGRDRAARLTRRFFVQATLRPRQPGRSDNV
jgi:hypothetical protein